MKRIRIILLTASVLSAIALSAFAPSCRREGTDHPKVIVIGFDGLDPRLCEKLMDEGKLPNLDRMRRAGGYRPLGTTIPPQSPVAWASFITGANPGVHGIFDFIHRDPKKQCEPYYSAAKTEGGDEGWDVGEHKIPLTFWPFNHEAPQTVLRRGGVPFWDYLDAAGVPIQIYDLPANYPPSESHHGHMCCLAGMGVPDLLGGYGTYQFFSEESFRVREENGGMRFPLIFEGDRADLQLIGPKNTYLKRPKDSTIPFEVHRHPAEAAARIEIQGQTIALREGEWSGWTKLDFELEMPSFLPNSHVSGICRFYLQEVRPTFKLYVSAINIDPTDPGEQKLTEPPEFIEEIASELGLFYTAGFQEDHKALSNEVFDDAQYRAQADHVLEERMKLLDFALEKYEGGLLFFYFSSTDLQAHMFWWDSDEKHPTRSPRDAAIYHEAIVDLYSRMDSVVGGVVERYGDEATILVMSDHGFCNFRRQFNLNTWLRKNGYLQPEDCRSILDPRRGKMADWSRTRAYGLGLNGLYVNLRGRERDGVVDPSEREQLLARLSEELLAVRDPLTNQPIVATVYRSDEVYSGSFASDAPDLIVGYHRGYRASWDTTLGNVEDEEFSDNRSAWSADHCVAADQVPGVIFSTRPIRSADPSLTDMAPTLLEMFGVPKPDSMVGVNLYATQSVAESANRE